jgi:hypothetical protein
MTSARSKKLKVDKKFQSIPNDERDEFYPNGIFEFNITKLLMFIKANPHIFQPEEVSVKSVRIFPFSHLNESTIQGANIAEPIILAEIAPDRFNVIDGNHRLERVYRGGGSKILAYKVHHEEHVAFLISKAAYEDYIKYWNSKLAEINENND